MTDEARYSPPPAGRLWRPERNANIWDSVEHRWLSLGEACTALNDAGRLRDFARKFLDWTDPGKSGDGFPELVAIARAALDPQTKEVTT
jgi:hypothetical protein